MLRFNWNMLLVMLVLFIILAGVSGIASADDCDRVYDDASNTEQLETTEDEIEYFILIDKDQECGTIRLYNTGDDFRIVLVSIFADEKDILSPSPELEPGENWSTTWDFSQKYDVTNETHSVRVSTTGPDLEANIEKDFDLSEPDIPAQQITDVHLNEEIDEEGDRIAKAAVTFENPSPHANPGHVFVHTTETHGESDLALVPRNEESATSYIELDDDPDGTIEGEIRYTTELIHEDAGVRDQVWFRGEVDGNVTVQRQEFEPVAHPTADDPYRYDTNESVSEHIPPSEQLVAGLLIGGVLVIVIGRRYWN
ncbi:hypothetical protein [Natranaeroarchaeum sulfidigenes]|uniref:Uncharacterized protein n=1 Tax=Natranaeroarchaeum sulfidigenes TaxID=2784880 RepID=A0A897MVP6_9EURY|nr:hypothetical protein [Natranaeroarchaeum sulfidigenes]QSG03143.1 hypothetical protein AArcS_1936 [Natranaeroarchaeum sulfidigenes]